MNEKMSMVHLYKDFWVELKMKDAFKEKLFSDLYIRPINYISLPTGLLGVSYVASLSKNQAMIQFEIKFNTRNANRKTLLDLAEQIQNDQVNIISKLDGYTVHLWDHALVIRKTLDHSVIDKTAWDSLAGRLLSEVSVLRAVIKPRLSGDQMEAGCEKHQ